MNVNAKEPYQSALESFFTLGVFPTRVTEDADIVRYYPKRLREVGFCFLKNPDTGSVYIEEINQLHFIENVVLYESDTVPISALRNLCYILNRTATSYKPVKRKTSSKRW